MVMTAFVFVDNKTGGTEETGHTEIKLQLALL